MIQPPAQGQPPAPQLQHCANVLDTVVKLAPGLLQAVFLMAKVRFLTGECFTIKLIFCKINQPSFCLANESFLIQVTSRQLRVVCNIVWIKNPRLLMLTY